MHAARVAPEPSDAPPACRVLFSLGQRDGAVLMTSKCDGNEELLNDPRVAELLLLLSEPRVEDDGMAIAELPDSLADISFLLMCLRGELIQFAQRKHCWIGGGKHRKLQMERGWDIAKFHTPGIMSSRKFLNKVSIENVLPKLRHHVQLTDHGYDTAERLKWKVRQGDSDEPKTDQPDGTDVPVEPGEEWTHWSHPLSKPRPDNYSYGPITGQKLQLNVALGGIPDGRAVVTANTLEEVWVIYVNRYRFEMWFLSEEEYNKAHARHPAEKKKTGPNPKR